MSDQDARLALDRLDGCHVFLSLFEIPPQIRDSLRARKIVWIDLANKERDRACNDMADEVLSFFRRYGVRTARCPRLRGAFEGATEAPVMKCARETEVTTTNVR